MDENMLLDACLASRNDDIYLGIKFYDNIV